MFHSPPQLMWDLTIHPPSEPNVLASTRSLLQSMSDPPFHLLQGPVSLLAHPLMSTPLRGLVSLLAHRPVFGSDTICHSQSPPLADIFLFWLSLSNFPSRFFKTCLLGRSFHTLIKNVSFSSPTEVRSHIITKEI